MTFTSIQTLHRLPRPLKQSPRRRPLKQILHFLSLSDGLPPLAEDVVDELGHGLGAAVAPALGHVAVPQVLHDVAHQLGEEVGDGQVVLGGRHLLEVAPVLQRRRPALLLAHLPAVAQVLLVPHQADGHIHLPGQGES